MLRTSYLLRSVRRKPAFKSFPRLTRRVTNRYISNFPNPNDTVNEEEPINFKRIGILGLGVSTIIYGLWWFYWPHHTFHPEVAKLLRKGLYQERSSRGNNYKEAMKFYIEALTLCQKLDLDYLSDEYTGIELKIAEMNEKLEDFDMANKIYFNLLERFTWALKDPEVLRNVQEKRNHYLKKDLQIVAKINENSKGKQLSSVVLLLHLLMAQRELSKLISASNEVDSFPNGDTINPFIAKACDPKVWQPFGEELFVVRDVYANNCLSKKDYDTAINFKFTTIQWMHMADFDPGLILLAQVDLGSMFYLKFEKIKAELVNPQEPEELLQNKKNLLLKLSLDCYDSVMNVIPFKSDSGKPVLEQLNIQGAKALSLAAYGQGVIKQEEGNYSEGKKLLKFALTIANEIGFRSLCDQIKISLSSKVDPDEQTLDSNIDML